LKSPGVPSFLSRCLPRDKPIRSIIAALHAMCRQPNNGQMVLKSRQESKNVRVRQKRISLAGHGMEINMFSGHTVPVKRMSAEDLDPIFAVCTSKPEPLAVGHWLEELAVYGTRGASAIRRLRSNSQSLSKTGIWCGLHSKFCPY
jgi:hypothetical protein